jgi:hypothetical protein
MADQARDRQLAALVLLANSHNGSTAGTLLGLFEAHLVSAGGRRRLRRRRAPEPRVGAGRDDGRRVADERVGRVPLVALEDLADVALGALVIGVDGRKPLAVGAPGQPGGAGSPEATREGGKGGLSQPAQPSPA